MIVPSRRHLQQLPSNEVHRRGTEWFDRIKPLLTERNPRDCVSIDVVSGEFEIAPEPLQAVERLRARLPDAEIFTRRVGSPIVHRIGCHPLTRSVGLRPVERTP